MAGERPAHHPRRKVILLDNDEQVARQVARVFGGAFIVVNVQNPRTVVGLMETDASIAAIITEQVLRSGAGVDLLETVRSFRPQVRRVIFTGYSDLAAIVVGIHSGAVQALLHKPASDTELLSAVCPELAERAAARRKASA
jgi:two-component system response regulator RegA